MIMRVYLKILSFQNLGTVPEMGLGLGMFWDSPKTHLSTIKTRDWDYFGNVSGQSQYSLRNRLGLFWDHLRTGKSTILYVGLGQSQDRLRTGTVLGRDLFGNVTLK